MGRPSAALALTLALLLPPPFLDSCTSRAGDASGEGHAPDSATAGSPSLPALLSAVDDHGAGGTLPVLDRLPPPTEIRKRPVPNRHDPALTDTVVTFVHPGLELEVYRVTTSGKEILRSIEVTGEGYRTGEGVGPGSTRARVTRALGEPDRVEGSRLVYRQREGEVDPTPTTLSIRFRGDRVAAMTWSFYVD